MIKIFLSIKMTYLIFHDHIRFLEVKEPRAHVEIIYEQISNFLEGSMRKKFSCFFQVSLPPKRAELINMFAFLYIF